MVVNKSKENVVTLPGISIVLPSSTHVQAFVVEFIITFFPMLVISRVTTDNRAIGELVGIAIGATVLLNVMLAGPITGASMNPTRSLGPALVHNEFRGIWIYLVSPTFEVWLVHGCITLFVTQISHCGRSPKMPLSLKEKGLVMPLPDLYQL